jgi:hemoglobin/transferrin/lactoferrin receptor protein
MSEQRLLFLQDDGRLQSATDVAGALSVVDMSSLERIDVIKGASSVLYGTGAMGGVVNFITQRPNYSENFKNSGDVLIGFSTVNQLWENAAKVYFTDKNWYVGLNGSYRTAQNTTTPVLTLNNSQFNDASWSLKGGMKYGDDQELKVGYSHFQAWDVGIPGGNSFPKSATVRYASIKRRQLNGEYIFTNINELIKELSIKAYTQNISRDVELKPNATNIFLPASFNVTSGVKATSQLYFNDYNNVTVGLETWLRDSESARTKINYGADTTFYIGEIPTPKAEMLDVGAFVLYNKVIDPHYFNINLGMRVDYIKTDNDTAFNRIFNYKIADGKRTAIPFGKNMIFDAGTHHDFSYSAHVDLNYTPAKRHKIILSLSNAYRVASIEERFKYIDLGNGVHLGDPTLKPENGFFSNLSYNLTLSKVLLRVDFFANYLFDMIAEEKLSSTIYKNQNIDQAFFAGAELDLNWLISRDMKFHTNASYVYTRNILEGTPLAMIPPANGNISLSYRLHKMMSTALSARWSATQNQLATNEVSTQGFVVLNFNIQTQAIKIQDTNLHFFAGVDNLLNKAYKNHLFNNRGLDFYEPGRNLFVKMKLGW